MHLPVLWACVTGQRGSSCWLLVSCPSFWLCLMPLLVVQGSEWTFIPLFTCCISLGNLGNFRDVYFIYTYIYVCVWYISHIHSLNTSNLHNHCLYGNCSCSFTPSSALVLFLLPSYLKKNTELQTAFGIDCNGIEILLSVHVIIFNSYFVLIVDELNFYISVFNNQKISFLSGTWYV